MKSIGSVILAVYVLLGSVGTPFSKHTCLANDTTEYGISIEDGCCNSGQKESIPFPQTNTPCCEFSSTYFQLDFNAFSFAGIIAFAAPVVLLNFDYTLPQLEEERLFKNTENFSPLLLYGRTLLAFVQTLVI